MNVPMADSGIFAKWILIAAISLATFPASAALCDANDDPPKNDAPAVDPPPHLENVDESLFGAKGARHVPAVRARLDRILRRKLNSAERIRRLNESQIQKLELAGRGDINRLFALIEE